MLETAEEYQQFIKKADPATIAACLRRDQESCRRKQLPSALAAHLPANAQCDFSDAIAGHLAPCGGIPVSVVRAQYQAIVGGIRAYLAQIHEVIEDRDPWEVEQKTQDLPSNDDLTAALKVLCHLEQHEGAITASTPLSDVKSAIQIQLQMKESFRKAYYLASSQPRGALGHQARCYICRMTIGDRRGGLHPALCRTCEIFNHNCSELSASGTFLNGRKALVTGGRINLGFCTALRLLRLGAYVIVSTRYPHDAEIRYAQEPDYQEWSARLKIVGADFRTAADAFRLVQAVKDILEEWNVSPSGGKLDILINNAAQTLTDPLVSEAKAVAREEYLLALPKTTTTLVKDHGYKARVRGGMQTPWMAGIEDRARKQIVDSLTEDLPNSKDVAVHKGLGGGRDEEQTGKSSWTQTLQEIPYEDLISAHAVNAFVPLILCRELLPIMNGERKSFAPHKHIVNVSSREGILEDRPDSASKAGHHVHTNMSKAAINMITESEAKTAWEQHRVCLNTVDPGYMSAAPEMEHLGPCPIGFDDGAARVLYPVAVGYTKNIAIRGRFLKHFGAVDAIIRRG